VKDELKPFSHENLYPKGEWRLRVLDLIKIQVHAPEPLLHIVVSNHIIFEMQEGNQKREVLVNFLYLDEMVVL